MPCPARIVGEDHRLHQRRLAGAGLPDNVEVLIAILLIQINGLQQPQVMILTEQQLTLWRSHPA